MSSCNQSSSFHFFIFTSPIYHNALQCCTKFSFSSQQLFQICMSSEDWKKKKKCLIEGEKRKEEERNKSKRDGSSSHHFLRRFFVVVGPSLLTFFGRRWKGKKVLEGTKKKIQKKIRVIYGFTACHHEVFFSTLSQDACDLERVQGVHEQWIEFGYHDQGAR